ncbi:Galactokinase [Lachnospiraceae bacterium TWA4]|nr:Galactokinase [Lachnospiraceae bacterium TWA4]
MKNTKALIQELKDGVYADRLKDIYVDTSLLEYQTKRYIKAIQKYEKLYGPGEVRIFSAPGRSEIGGNHTDHQHGMVLAASINLDAIAISSPLEGNEVQIVSGKYPMVTINLDELDIVESEKGTTKALIKGVFAGLKNRGYKIGAFKTYITSDVLIGAGLSSSAAFETIIGTIISGFYNNMEISPVVIAQVGQYAESVYFGKPCGLMDQMACSVGSMVHIDFADPENPIIEKVEYDLEAKGYALCIVDCKASHADLTEDYAMIPIEMKKIANYFKKDYLRDVNEADFFANIAKLRKVCGDRAVMRAIHFFGDNARVAEQVKALKEDRLADFLAMVKASGDSSFKNLQNVYTNRQVQNQSMSIGLAISEKALGSEYGVCRVHGGGFAGTIQAFVKNEYTKTYKKIMENIYGKGACHILKIRKYGGMEV